MSSIPLNPVAAAKIEQFQLRYLQQRTVTTIAFASLAFVVGVLIGMLVDHWIELSLGARFGLTATVYAAIAIVAVWNQRRDGAGRLSANSAATRIESLAPQVKQYLLAAVELSAENSQGSASFREKVQEHAGAMARPVVIPQLLPWKNVSRPVVFALLALCGLLISMFMPNWNISQRLARVLWPLLNIGRLSAYTVEIIEPNPASKSVAWNDMVLVQASVRGPKPTHAVIQFRNSTAAALQTANMDSEASQVFSGLLVCDSSRIDYRVVAHGASSAWHSLEGHYRPKLIDVEKRYQLPEYVQSAQLVVNEEHGDLRQVQGTRVQVSFNADQPLSQMRVSLQANYSDSPSEIRLERRSDTQWIGEFELNQPAKYRLEMVATSGLSNAPTRLFVVEPVEDKSPQIAWDDSLKIEPLIHRQQELHFGVSIRDEFPVQSVTELARINGSQWLTTSLQLSETEVSSITNAGAMALAEAHWSRRLKDLPLRPGDVLEIKVQALDRKGQSAESSTKRFVVAAELIADRDTQYIWDRLDLSDAVRRLRTEVVDQIAAMLADIDAERKKPIGEQEFAETGKQQGKLAKLAKSATDRVANAIDIALESAPNSAARNEVERQGQLIARIQYQMLTKLSSLAGQLEVKNGLSEAEIKQKSADYHMTLNQLRDHVVQLDERARGASHNDVLVDLVREAESIKQAQQRIETLTGSQEQLRQQNLLIEELEQLSRKASAYQPRLSNDIQNVVENLNSMAISAAEKIREQLEQKVAITEITKHTLDRMQQVNHARSRVSSAAGELSNGNANVANRAGSVSEDIEPLAAAIDQSNNPGRANSHEQTILQQLVPAVRQLAERRELHRLRPDSDTAFAADMGTAVRAIEDLLIDRQSDPQLSAKKLREVSGALGQLEAVHDARQAAAQLDELIYRERWQADSPESFLETPRIWDDVPQAFAAAAHNLRRFGGSHELAGRVDNLRWNQNASQAAQKLGQRRWDQNFKVTSEHDLRALKADYDALKDALDQVAQQARKTLSQHAPSIAELAQRAADQSRELSQQSSELQQATEQKQVPDVGPQLARLERLQGQAADRTQRLQQALSDLSDSQQQLSQQDPSVAQDSQLANRVAEQAKEKILSSLDSINANSQTQSEVSRLLDLAKQQQSSAAEMLEKIAQHFANAESQDREQSRSQLQQLVENANSDATQPQSQRTDRLKAIANSDARKVLEQLEKVLPKNSAMQAELDQIANGLDQRAERMLDFAAAKERQIRAQLENSDSTFQQHKRDLVEQLRQTSEQIDSFANQFAQQATNTTHRDKSLQDEREQIQLAQQKLREASSAGRSTNPDAPVSELLQSQQQMQQAVKQASEILAQQTNDLRSQVENPKFDKAENLSRAQQELNNHQNQIQKQRTDHAAQLIRHSEGQLKQAEDQSKHRNQELERKEKAATQARQKLNAEPNNDGLKYQARVASEQAATAQRDASVVAQQVEAAKQRLENAKATKQRIEQQASAQISRPNPVAESTANFTQRAAEEAQQAAEKLQRANPQEWMDRFESPHQGLSSANQDQQSVTQAIRNTASDLSRAARHDSRLQDTQQAKQLEQHASAIDGLANGKLSQAGQQLQSAAEQTRPADANSASAASPQTGNQLRQALMEAEQSLRDESTKLSNTNLADTAHASATNPTGSSSHFDSASSVQNAAPPNQNSGNPNNSQKSIEETADAGGLAQAWQASLTQGSEDTSATGSRPASSPTATETPLSAQQMARLLDELDQQLNRDNNLENSNPQNSNQDATVQPNQSASNSGSNKPVQSTVLTQALRQSRAQMSAEQRSASRSSRAEQRSDASFSPSNSHPDGQSQISTNPRGGAGRKEVASGTAFAQDPNQISERMWGKLRSQHNEDAVKSDREQVAPRFRVAVDNYFRKLAEQGQSEGAK